MYVCFDCETHLGTDTVKQPKPVCASFAEYGKPGYVQLADESVSTLEKYIDSGYYIVNAFPAYDFAVYLKWYPHLTQKIFDLYENGRVLDILTAAMLTDIATTGSLVKKGYTLASVAKTYLRLHVEKEDTWRKRYAELDGVSLSSWPKEAIEYSRKDAEIPLQVFSKMDLSLIPDLQEQTYRSFCLYLMTCAGMRTDKKQVLELERNLILQLHELANSCSDTVVIQGKDGFSSAHRLIDPPFINSRGKYISPKRKEKPAREYIKQFPSLTLDHKLTGTGDLSLSGDALEETSSRGISYGLFDENNPLLKYTKFTKLQKRIGNDIKLVKANGNFSIHAHFRSPKETGRIGSSPNVQNFNQDGLTKRTIIPPTPDHILANADYSGLELATLAQVLYTMFGQCAMATALQEGKDLHCDVASEILGWSYDDVVAAVAAGNKEAKDARQLAKIANFGFPGGLGYERLTIWAWVKFGRKMTIQEAKTLKRNWLRKYPEMRKYFKVIAHYTDYGRPITQLFSNRIRAGVSYTEACNSFFQGLGADATGYAFNQLTRACYAGHKDYPYLYGCRVINYIHDEFLLSMPRAYAHWAAKDLERLMITEARKYLPDIPLKTEAVLMNFWEKDLKPKYNEQGLLISSN